MENVIQQHRDRIAELCRRYHVRRLELFGSVASGTFDPQRSDIDLLVEFSPGGDQDRFHQYFGLNEALNSLFGRKVDLVMVGALKNPYFIESVNRKRQLVYAAPVAQTA